MIRVIIVDDEAPARQRLRRLLATVEGVEIVGEAENGVQALEAVNESSPDLMFLDIEMPELDGLETARTLGIEGPVIIFATAYDEYALKAFETAAVDYLVKPIAKARLIAAIDKAKKSLSSKPVPDLASLINNLSGARKQQRLALRVGSKFVVFNVMDVSAVLAQDHYAAVICQGKELLSDDSLDAIGSRLDEDRFLRVHRSAIINLDYLSELDRQGDRKYVAVLADEINSRVPVSRERLPQLKKRLGLS